jgi:ribosomal protein S18 acetylase RimI-like enzyme
LGLNNVDDSEKGIEKFLKRNTNTCFVAEENELIIGAILTGNNSRRGYIYHTCTLENQRQKGIGRKLVDSVITALKNEGIAKVALVMFEKNEIGNGFWEKIGFTVREDLIYRNFSITEIEKIDT